MKKLTPPTPSIDSSFVVYLRDWAWYPNDILGVFDDIEDLREKIQLYYGKPDIHLQTDPNLEILKYKPAIGNWFIITIERWPTNILHVNRI